MAVAIWDHRPVAEELLTRRLERGWRPTPTAMQDGAVILGYAACGSREIGAAEPWWRASQGEFPREDDHMLR